jgi:hypothetical protein
MLIPLLVFAGLVLTTTIPSYELAVAILFGCSDYFYGPSACAEPSRMPRNAALVLMTAPMLVAGACATLFTAALTRLLLDHSPRLRVLDGWGWGGLLWGAQNLLYGTVWAMFAPPFAASEAMAWLYRLRGARIGRGAVLNGWAVSEAHRVVVGDGAVLDGCHLAPHVWEQGLLLFAHSVEVGAGAVVQHCAMLLNGAHVPAGAVVGPNSHGSADAFAFGGASGAQLLQGCPVVPVTVVGAHHC